MAAPGVVQAHREVHPIADGDSVASLGIADIEGATDWSAGLRPEMNDRILSGQNIIV